MKKSEPNKIHIESSFENVSVEPDSDNNSFVSLEHVKYAGNTQVCEENSDMNGMPAMPNSGATWGFGLQLASPTQRFPAASFHATSHVASEMIDKGTWLADAQTISSRESSREIRNNIVGSIRIHTQNQNMDSLGGQVANNQRDSVLPMLSGINQIHPGDSAMQISALDDDTTPYPSITFNPSLHDTQSKVLRNVGQIF
ncbi:hypothetical protein RYX36_005076 [Vicia faba]